VSKLGDGFLTIEIASGVEVQMQRSAVIQVLPKGSMK
jgi:preprotein translocase subunit YajC